MNILEYYKELVYESNQEMHKVYQENCKKANEIFSACFPGIEYKDHIKFSDTDIVVSISNGTRKVNYLYSITDNLLQFYRYKEMGTSYYYMCPDYSESSNQCALINLLDSI